MNYLQIVQRLFNESGMRGSSPSTVVSQTGNLADLVRWAETAYEDIQALHDTWDFLRNDFSFSTVAAQQNYTLSGLSLTELAKWKTDDARDIRCYSTASDEQYLAIVDWIDFKNECLFGSNRSQSGRPTVCAIKPDKSISFFPIPDAIYTINGEYFKRPQQMALDADEPLFRSNQMVIVWRALMYYAADDGADDIYTHAQNEYTRMLNALERNELPAFKLGGPLA